MPSDPESQRPVGSHRPAAFHRRLELGEISRPPAYSYWEYRQFVRYSFLSLGHSLAQASEPSGDGLANLAGGIFLKKMLTADRDLFLIAPGATELEQAAR
jgi:hypothetical protein